MLLTMRFATNPPLHHKLLGFVLLQSFEILIRRYSLIYHLAVLFTDYLVRNTFTDYIEKEKPSFWILFILLSVTSDFFNKRDRCNNKF